MLSNNYSVPILGEDPPPSLTLVFLKNDEQYSEENKKGIFIAYCKASNGFN